MTRSLINIVFFLFIFQSSLSAKLYNKVDIISTDDGLSQNVINAIFQDSKGFIWFGTNDGLNRYDGYEFNIYKNDFFNDNSLTDNIVTCILEDNENNLWVGTGSGLSKLNLLSNKFEQETLPEKLIITLKDKFITSLELDLNNDLWIGTKSGLYKLITKSNEFVDFTDNSLPLSELSKKHITALKRGPDGKIWIAIKGDILYSFNLVNNNLNKINISSNEHPYYIVRFIKIFSDTILVGTNVSNIRKIDLSNNEIALFTEMPDNLQSNLPDIQLNSNHNILSITYSAIWMLNPDSMSLDKLFDIKFESGLRVHLIDKSGVLWVGTNGAGIYKILYSATKFITVKKRNKITPGLSFNSVRTMFVDNKNKLWVGGHHSIDTCTYRPGNFQNWGELVQFRNNNVYSIVQDPVDENIYWIGAEMIGLLKYDKLNPNSYVYMSYENEIIRHFSKVYKILVSSTKIIYIGTSKGLVTYNPFNGEFKSFIDSTTNSDISIMTYIKAIYEDSNGLIWIGSADEGAAVYNPETNEIKKIKAKSSDYPFCGNRINTFCEGDNGIMWVGTENGLNKFDRERETVTIYSLNKYLRNSYIYGILKDKNGNLWFSTNGGLYKFNPKTEKFTNFDDGHGLQSNEFNTVAFYKNKNGEMFFGGVKGFSAFFPEEIRFSDFKPEVLITKFKKSNQPVHLNKSIIYADTIELYHNDHFFSFDFASTDFVNPGKIQFRYMLEDFQHEWIYTDKFNRSAGFTNIDPGKYKLRVAATNHDGILSTKEKVLTIIVHPAFWETFWFWVTILLLIILFVYLIINSRFRKLKKEKQKQLRLHERIISIQEEERKSISSELHDDLGQNLLVVKNKLLMAEKDETFDQVSESMDILDDTIQDLSNMSHYLHPTELDELGLLRAVEAMAARLSRSTGVEINIELDDIDKFFAKADYINLFRIFQEALNNIIKHAKATTVILKSIKKSGRLKITISDNGIGFLVKEQVGKEDRPRFGISGMKERVHILDGKFQIDSKPGSGTKITLEFTQKEK